MSSREAQPAVVATGASTGIGKAIALALDANGLRVFAGVRNEADGEKLRRFMSAGIERKRHHARSSREEAAA